MLIFFFLLATAKYFDCNSTNCQIRLDYPKPICFNLSKDNHAIGCDNEILTIIDYYYIYEGFKFIGFEPKLSHFNKLMIKAEKAENRSTALVVVPQVYRNHRRDGIIFLTSYFVFLFLMSRVIVRF